MPHFKTEENYYVSSTKTVQNALEKVRENKLIIIDNNKININNQFKSVYHDFQNNIYEALEKGLDKLKKYSKIILVYPSKSTHPYPIKIIHRFQKFCSMYNFEFEIINQINKINIDSRIAYVIIEEVDLASLLKQIKTNNLTLGKDVAIISYNDTPLKDLLGINIISTNYIAMGKMAANLITKRDYVKIKNSFEYIERGSV